MAHRDQLDDVLDARAQMRALRDKVKTTKAAWDDAKTELRDASERFESVLTEIEQKQGRLPFDPSAGKTKGKPGKRDQDEEKGPRSQAV